MAEMRIALIGCVATSLAAMRALLAAPEVRLVGVITRGASKYNSDFVDLTPLAREHGIPVLYVEEALDDQQQAAWLREREAELVFCIGWSRLLRNDLLGSAPRGVVGFHPAALPANRGRHPLIWALVLGLEQTASSFFFMEAATDSGPLLSQQAIAIEPQDDAASLYAKVLEAIPGQVQAIVRGLADGTLVGQPQDPALATHWRKRGPSDGQVDWRMSAVNIHNLVRALTRPYPGAHFIHGDAPVKLWKTELVDEAPANAEPGKVLSTANRQPVVKCGSGAIRLLEHELSAALSPGDYL